MMRTRPIYMEITTDEYELPLAVADTIDELARIVHRKPSTLNRSINHAKHGRYIRVVIEEDLESE